MEIATQKSTGNFIRNSLFRMYVEDNDSDNLICQLEYNPNHTVSQEFPSFDIMGDQKFQMKDTVFDVVASINPIKFKELCIYATKFSEYVEITCTKNKITFKYKHYEKFCSETFINNNQYGDKSIIVKSFNDKYDEESIIVRSVYDLKRLITFNESIDVCKEFRLYLKNNGKLHILMPLILSFLQSNMKFLTSKLMPIYEI